MLAEAVWVPTFRGIVLEVVSAVALAVPLSAGAGHDMHRPAVTGRGDAFDPVQLPPTCANRIGEHFLCVDYAGYGFRARIVSAGFCVKKLCGMM